MFEKNMLLKVFALVAIVMIVGIGFIMSQEGQFMELVESKSNSDSATSLSLKENISYQYYPAYNSHEGERGFLMGIIGSSIFFGSALLAWNTIGPGKKKDAKPVEKEIDFPRMIVHAMLAAICFSFIAGAIVGLTLDWFSNLLESDFMKLFLLLGFLFPLYLFAYLASRYSMLESALSSMLQFGFTLILFPASFLLFLLISEILWPTSYYIM